MSAILPQHSALHISQVSIKYGHWQHIYSSYLKFIQLESIAHAHDRMTAFLDRKKGKNLTNPYFTKTFWHHLTWSSHQHA